MAETGAVLTAEQYRQVVQRVVGVISCRPVVGENGSLTELHVLAAANRSPKQVVRDIESAVMVQLGVEIDHKVISVAQIREEDVLPGPVEVRPLLENVRVTTRGSRVEVAVSLDFTDQSSEGYAEGANTSLNKLRLVAVATLQAVEKHLGECGIMAVDELLKLKLSRGEAVLVSVSLVAGNREEYLLGTALVQSDYYEAVGRATLAAVNRRLAFLVSDR